MEFRNRNVEDSYLIKAEAKETFFYIYFYSKFGRKRRENREAESGKWTNCREEMKLKKKKKKKWRWTSEEFKIQNTALRWVGKVKWLFQVQLFLYGSFFFFSFLYLDGWIPGSDKRSARVIGRGRGFEFLCDAVRCGALLV